MYLDIVAIIEQLLKLMSSVCILIYVSMYVSIYLYSYASTHGIFGLAAGGSRAFILKCV